jgi:hypothetical protein
LINPYTTALFIVFINTPWHDAPERFIQYRSHYLISKLLQFLHYYPTQTSTNMTNNTTNQHLSSVDDFIRSNTDKIGISSPSRRPASKKIRESIVTSSGPKDLNFTGTPLKRKNPHRAARAGGTEDVGMKLPPAISSQENLAASEKPPEPSAADKLEKRKVERREEKKALADRKARKEIRRLEKEEVKKRKELAALDEVAAAARQSEEAAEAIRLEREKKDAKEAKEARRIARVESKAAKAAEKKATMAAIAKEK